jgi:predicted MFS family arabinose efflux permease
MNRYQELLRLPHVKSLILSAFPARMAYGMVGLSIFFKTIHETNSIPLAGLAIGLNSLSGSFTSGVRGSIIDRYGQKWPIRIFVPAYVAMLLMLNLAHSSHSILILSFILGFTAPPISLSVRPIWKSIVPRDVLRTAYALDTSVINASGVIGPILATTLALSAHPSSALVTCAALMLIGGTALSLNKAVHRWIPEVKELGTQPVWRHPAMLLLMFEGCFIGFGWGAFNVGVPAFATLQHVPHRTAWILSAMGVANIVGGLLGGLVSRKSSPLKSLLATYAAWFIVSLPLFFTHPDWTMALVGVFLGLCGGALQVFYWEVMEAVRPRGSATASMGWLWTVEGSLMAIGSAVGGWISKALSPQICLGITTISIGCGLTVLTVGRSRLSAARSIPSVDEDLLAMEVNASPSQ